MRGGGLCYLCILLGHFSHLFLGQRERVDVVGGQAVAPASDGGGTRVCAPRSAQQRAHQQRAHAEQRTQQRGRTTAQHSTTHPSTAQSGQRGKQQRRPASFEPSPPPPRHTARSAGRGGMPARKTKARQGWWLGPRLGLRSSDGGRRGSAHHNAPHRSTPQSSTAPSAQSNDAATQHSAAQQSTTQHSASQQHSTERPARKAIAPPSLRQPLSPPPRLTARSAGRGGRPARKKKDAPRWPGQARREDQERERPTSHTRRGERGRQDHRSGVLGLGLLGVGGVQARFAGNNRVFSGLCGQQELVGVLA